MAQVYHVKPEHVGNEDIMQFLRKCISREFGGKEYYIVNESTLDKILPGYPKPRRIVSFGVESAGVNQAVHFDVTDVVASNSTNWGGNHR
jgi:hypothetical protein